VIDGTMSPPIEDGAVVYSDDTLRWVGRRADLPEKFRHPPYEQIALEGRTILPGLIDGHTHIAFGEARTEEELALYTPVEYRTLKAAMNAYRVLQAGVTSAFDAATTYNIAPCLRDAIDVGMCQGPRFAVSGRQLTTHQGLEDSFPNEMQFPPGQAAVLVKNKDEMMEAIRYQVKDRVDCIKVSGSNDNMITPDSLDGSALTDEELSVIATEARRLGVMSSIHARSRDSVIGAAKAGFDLIFHASCIDDEGIELCLKNNVVITPTLTLLVNILNATKGVSGDSHLDAVIREVDAAREGLSKAHRAGVPMICGSESGWSPVPYGQWHAYEMQIFVDYLGFTPLEAINSATLTATRVLKRFGHRVGRLEAGRYADIIVVKGDPSKDVSILNKKKHLELVIKGGRKVDLTPLAPPRQWFYERNKTILNGKFEYDQESGQGVLRR
jgi:imidazolonepropionase-like amidohydrolase